MDKPRTRTGSSQTRKSDIVYQSIKQRILDGTYSSGFRLVIGRLADEFGFSALPVRDAITRLSSERYVMVRPNVGAEVVGVDPDEFADTIETIAYLEGATASMSLNRLRSEDIELAVQLNERMRAGVATLSALEFAELNQQFHELMCGSCPNPYILSLLESQWGDAYIVLKSAYTIVPGAADLSVAEHDELLRLLTTGVDARTFETEVREHRLRMVDIYRATTKKNASEAPERISPAGGWTRLTASAV